MITAVPRLTALLLTLAALGASSLVAQQRFFHTPESPFITSPDEDRHTVSLTSGSVGQVQAALDAARSAQPDAVLVLRLAGTFTVDGQPLRVGSKTCVVFGGGARLVATAKTEALLSITGAELVSISSTGPRRAVLDGAKRSTAGVVARSSGKVTIDNVIVTNCVGIGIDYSGRGEGVLCDAGSITRCRVSNCPKGAVVREAAQFVCVDSAFLRCEAVGLDIGSTSATVVGNLCAGSAVGLHCRLSGSAVARNLLIGNGAGLALDAASKLNFVSYNRLADNGVGMAINGEKNSVYCNELANKEELTLGGSGNIIARQLLLQ